MKYISKLINIYYYKKGMFMKENLALSFYPVSLEQIQEKVERKQIRKKNKINDLLQLDLFYNNKSNNTKIMEDASGNYITRVDGEIPVDLPVRNGERFLFISYDQSILTHGIHKYPAKFFPELPRWFINRYSKEGDFILDPFAGSGTTNVEALLNKRHSVGIDIDPFSRLLLKVKVTPLNEKELLLAQQFLLGAIQNFHIDSSSHKDLPDFPYRDNWFNKEILYELAYIKKQIEIMDVSEDIKDYYKISFSSIIRSVSNADDNCTRTVVRKKLNKKVYPADALKKFVEAILVGTPKMIEFSKMVPEHIDVILPENMDARDIKYNDDYFDLAITSPPYANAVDYPRAHQLESYWLGLVEGSLTPLKKKHVGTESVSFNDYSQLHVFNIEIIDTKISAIFKKDPRRAFIAYKYLRDMENNLSEVYRVLKKGGRYIIVVGNNKIRGEVFENWKYIIKLAEKAGFTIENYFASEIIKHFIKVPREERISTDWILILRK